MSRKQSSVPIRTAILVLTLMMNAGWLLAQPSSVTSLGGLILADRFRTRALRDAQELIDQGKYVDGLKYLDTLLDQSEDQLLRPKSDAASRTLTSLHAKIEAIIAELPPEGQKVYLRTAGPRADALLQDALKKNSASELSEVISRYFYTPAGFRASYLMGLRRLDQGESVSAALIFEKLRRIPEAARQFEPALTLHISMSWLHAGFPDRAKTNFERLAFDLKSPDVQLGGRRRSLFTSDRAPSAWLARLLEQTDSLVLASSESWLLPGKNVARNPILPATLEISEAPGWNRRTVEDPFNKLPDDEFETPVDQLIQKIIPRQLQQRTVQSRHTLPGRRPLVIGDKIYSRTLESVRSFDLTSGDFIALLYGYDQSLEQLASTDLTPLPNAESYLRELIDQRLWDDRTFGLLSSDGERVFCIEDTGFWRDLPKPPNSNEPGLQVRKTSVLAAFDLDAGKRLWDVGGLQTTRKPRPLAGRYFLGVPLPLAGQLFCLVENNDVIELNVLEASSGNLLWSQSLASISPGAIGGDMARRTAGTSVAYGNGVLVCPTDTGATVALDLTTRRLLWGYPTDINPSFLVLNRAVVRRRQPQAMKVIPQGWADTTPIIAGRKVVLTPLKSAKIYLLDLMTGERIWEHPRGTGLYVAGVTDDMVVVVGQRNVQTWSLNSDQSAWPDARKLTEIPTGRGIIMGDYLLLPAAKKIVLVDLKTGREIRDIPVPNVERLGNLAVVQGRLVSQGINSLDVLPFPEIPELTGKENSNAKPVGE